MKQINTNPARRLLTVLLTAAAVAAGVRDGRAATVNVFSDPSFTWNGYVTIYTNGLVNTTWPPYIQQYLGTGTSFPNQSSIDTSGNVTCAPDI